ncbi:MAG: 6-carboxytetrahydropterin synthase [Candidatus Korobacteraceae bacterium]|jgi:6-pyruvoyltetrahydropterin/6-carboxytetrahydropterin synthase
MKAYLTRRYWLAASHRLHSDRLSAEQNRATYGKCNNPHGHGHNYLVEITVSGQVDPRTGMVCNLVELDGVVTREVLERFDHQNLNCMPEFRELVPTSENLCQVIYHIVQQYFSAARLEKVRLEETSMNSFEYLGEEPESERDAALVSAGAKEKAK